MTSYTLSGAVCGRAGKTHKTNANHRVGSDVEERKHIQ